FNQPTAVCGLASAVRESFLQRPAPLAQPQYPCKSTSNKIVGDSLRDNRYQSSRRRYQQASDSHFATILLAQIDRRWAHLLPSQCASDRCRRRYKPCSIAPLRKSSSMEGSLRALGLRSTTRARSELMLPLL